MLGVEEDVVCFGTRTGVTCNVVVPVIKRCPKEMFCKCNSFWWPSIDLRALEEAIVLSTCTKNSSSFVFADRAPVLFWQFTLFHFFTTQNKNNHTSHHTSHTPSHTHAKWPLHVHNQNNNQNNCQPHRIRQCQLPTNDVPPPPKRNLFSNQVQQVKEEDEDFVLRSIVRVPVLLRWWFLR